MLKIMVKVIFLFVFVIATIHCEKIEKEKEKNADVVRQDPCATFHCGHGRQCVVVDKEQAKCECIKQCPENNDTRRMVCSNANTTWQSDCHLYRHRCLCLEGQESCKEADKHLHINYYGECHDIPECESDVLIDFPRRMRDWLYRVMMKKHNVNKTEALSQTDLLATDWVIAVIWKYCDLDAHPNDRYVSRHELFPLRAPLLSMEPCITNFLDDCDANDDHKITLTEWGKCLGAPEGEMEYKCSQFYQLHKHNDVNEELSAP